MKSPMSIGELEVVCPECWSAYRACLDMVAYKECVKHCLVCNGTARDPIPWAELFNHRANG